MQRLTRTFLLTLVAASAVVATGDPQPAQAPQAPAAPPATTKSPAAPPAPAGDIQDFVPTERVKADDAVAFPTDI